MLKSHYNREIKNLYLFASAITNTKICPANILLVRNLLGIFERRIEYSTSDLNKCLSSSCFCFSFSFLSFLFLFKCSSLSFFYFIFIFILIFNFVLYKFNTNFGTKYLFLLFEGTVN